MWQRTALSRNLLSRVRRKALSAGENQSPEPGSCGSAKRCRGTCCPACAARRLAREKTRALSPVHVAAQSAVAEPASPRVARRALARGKTNHAPRRPDQRREIPGQARDSRSRYSALSPVHVAAHSAVAEPASPRVARRALARGKPQAREEVRVQGVSFLLQQACFSLYPGCA